jgi:hypothetical protein
MVMAICARDVEHPDVISTFFQDSNVINAYNQCRQHNLALEKKWLTTDVYFWLATMLIGINMVDCYRLADFHQFH